MFFPLRPSVCLSGRLSVRLPVTKSCPLCSLKTVRDSSTKLHTLVKHIQTTCHEQEPEPCLGYFWSYFPLAICDAISCPLFNLITIGDNETSYTCKVYLDDVSGLRTIILLCIFLKLFPFDMLFCVRSIT